MREEEFHNLIIKFFDGEISREEINTLKSQLEQDSEKRRLFNEENDLWQQASLKIKRENYIPDEAWRNLVRELGFEKSVGKSVKIININNFRIIVAAAVFACLLAIGGIGLWMEEKKATEEIGIASTIVITSEGEKSHVFLADSSIVVLNSGSKLEYNGLYNIKDRKVKLTGEAYFNVNTNKAKPFVVEVADLNIIATGTRFNILAYSNEDRVETTLEAGKVQVLIKGHELIDLDPGEQANYFKRSGKIQIHEVPVETYTSWKENKLRLINTPFEEALRKIARKYDVTFEITGHDLLNLNYTATFIDESIEEVMQMLKAVSPITYKINYRTTINDKQYLKPKIVVGKRINKPNPKP